MMCGGHTFSIVTGAFQVLLLIMMAVSVDYASYDDSLVDGKKRSPGDANATVFYYSCKYLVQLSGKIKFEKSE